MSKEFKFPDNVFLEIAKGSGTGKKFPLTEKSMSIGRAQDCTVTIESEFVSRRHAQIVFRCGHFTIIDLASRNKTKVNGHSHLEKNLKHLDIIAIGDTELVFNWPDQESYTREYLSPDEKNPH
ncbi:MAG: hypothetical protein A2096_03710 [Spirochaetes bacterium GWF1_41_5]|nr:MAG: hypothetical protein A2096_03710 [Spirochaetes bacterium GWF1_41_5]